MRIGIISDGVISNVLEGNSIEYLTSLLYGDTPPSGIFLMEVPQNCGVGDRYSGGRFILSREFVEIPEEITLSDLQRENKLLKAQLQAQTERSDFIEDCIAEMATMVYGGV